MPKLQKTAGVHFEKQLAEITPEHKVILISLGGMAASQSHTADDIQELSRRLENETIFSFWGEGHVVTRSRVIAKNIVAVADTIKNRSGVEPRIIMVGKSMGGHKLWRTCHRLNKLGKQVDLFIGVDVSGSVSRHHQDFIDSCGEEGAHWFHKNVKSLYGFYQTTPNEIQTGAPLFYYRSQDETYYNVPPEKDGAINIQVYQTPFNTETCMPDEESGDPITNQIVTHATIDTNKPLLQIIEKLVKKAIS